MSAQKKDYPNDRELLKIIARKPGGSLAIFNKGDYYAIYGQDAVLVATHVFKSNACLKNFTLEVENAFAMPYITMNNGQYEKVVREAISLLRYRVQLYKAVEGEWIIEAKGTSGNTGDFDDIMAECDKTGNFAVFLHPTADDNLITVCSWDLSELRIVVSEFTDTSTFDQLEQCLIGLNPTNCVVIKKNQNAEREKKVADLLKKLGVMEAFFNTKVEWIDVCGLLKQDFVDAANELSDATKVCMMTLCAFSLNTDELEEFKGKFSLNNYGTSGFMRIDAAAVNALELFKLSYNYGNTESATLFFVMNHCKTMSGQKLLRDWLARPLVDLRLLEERQDVVAALFESSHIRESLHLSLARMPDCSQLARRLLRKNATLQDLYRAYQVVSQLARIDAALLELTSVDGQKYKAAVQDLLLEQVRMALLVFEKFVDLISNTIDMEYYKKTNDFRVRPDLDPEMSKLNVELNSIEADCEKVRKKLAAKTSIDGIKLDRNAQYGFFFRITLKEEKNIRKFKELVLLDSSKSNGVRFRVKELDEYNARFQSFNETYKEMENNLTGKLIETSRGYAFSLSSLSSTIALIDVLVSLADVAATNPKPFVRPKLFPMGSGSLELKQCRHPVVESQSGSQFIPNDVDLNDERRMVVLTGANMGGKSTYLRSAAICVLLAQIGSFVPADDANVSIVDGIFTRVGAGDQQSQGISTFMAEMLDCANILRQATKNSFVVIDELGRGTSTFDGFGLASAIADDVLNRISCFCLFATHFHEMATVAQQQGAVAMQVGVSLENNQITMLYQIREGVAQSSFGLEVAQAVGLNEAVILDAELSLAQLEHKKEDSFIQSLKKVDKDELRKFLLS